MSTEETFETVRSALEGAGVRYAVGGSWASTAFGEPRFTNDVDILAEFDQQTLKIFLGNLPATFYASAEESSRAVQEGRPFNVIHMPTVLKFDFFPADAFPLGGLELDRAISLTDTGLSRRPTKFVTPEDIVLAKLHWFRLGGETSEVQWRDIRGVIRGCAARLDYGYPENAAEKLQIRTC